MVEKMNYWINGINRNTMLHIYLPDNYYQTNERYPVMYMFDGQNLFDDNDATYGKSWGIKAFLDAYDKGFIVVGIECDHNGNERLNEYCPYDIKSRAFGELEGRGRIFMEWVIKDLKPFIDREYRTYSFREATGIAGSSMGGLMAFYSVLHYNHIFSKAACLSPSFMICQRQLDEEFSTNYISPDTRIYMSFGTNEFKNTKYRNFLLNHYNQLILNNNAYAYVNVIKGGKHNEASWEKENKTYYDFLWK